MKTGFSLLQEGRLQGYLSMSNFLSGWMRGGMGVWEGQEKAPYLMEAGLWEAERHPKNFYMLAPCCPIFSSHGT